MDPSEHLKDPGTIMAGAALLGLGTASYYFHNRVSELETQVKEIKTHLMAIIPLIDPRYKERMEQLINTVNRLEYQINQGNYHEPQPYVRLTKKSATLSDDKSLDDEIALMSEH